MNKVKFIFWHNISIIMLFLAMGITALLIFWPNILPCGKELEALIAIIVSYLGFLYNLINYKIAKDKFFKELFTEFNARFDNLNEALNEIFEGKMENFRDEISKRNIIGDYLNLCAEEYLWYKKGRIEPDVWYTWKEGMRYYLNNKFIQCIYAEHRKNEGDAYYGLMYELDKINIGVENG